MRFPVVRAVSRLDRQFVVRPIYGKVLIYYILIPGGFVGDNHKVIYVHKIAFSFALELCY